MCFSLVGSDTGHKLQVGEFADGWNFTSTNKKDCVSASGNGCDNTLCEADEVFSESVGPDVLVRPSYEVTGHSLEYRHLI